MTWVTNIQTNVKKMNESSLKIAIFDCDGVLFNSLEANRAYYNDIAVKSGREPLTREELTYCHMHTADESIRYLFRKAKDSMERAFRIAEELDYSDYLKFMTIEPGMVEVVSGLRNRIRTAISTNRSTTMPRLVDIYGLDRLFHQIVSALDVERPKPDPEGVFKILEREGLDSRNAIYIGDSMVDQVTASNAEMKFIAYKNSDLKADFYADNFYEIGRVIEDLLLSSS